MPTIRHVLVIRFSSLGDVILTTPLLRALKRDLPAAEITYVTKSRYAPLLRRNPGVTRIVELRPGESLRSLCARIRRHGSFDVALDLHKNLRSLALRRMLGGRWNGYNKHRFKRSIFINLGVDSYAPHASVSRWYCATAENLGVTPDPGPPEVFPSVSAINSVPDSVDDSTIILAPGARHETKRWPAYRWAQLHAELVAGGHKVLALGQEGERRLLANTGITGLYDLPLEVTAATIRRARILIANDSGLMHLATAVGTRVIALFGPTVRQFGFFPHASSARVLERDLSCRPCSASGSSRCPLGHHSCLDSIEPNEIMTMIEAA